jgi:hypothetical protein
LFAPPKGMKSIRNFLLISFLLGIIAFPSASFAQEHLGYIKDVQAEKQERFYEIYLFLVTPPHESRLQDTIFNPELSKEFKLKYQDKFGQIDTDSIGYQKANFAAFEQDRYGKTGVEKEDKDRNKFADYMVKRLAEWHVDHFFKSDPNMRPVYEMKERLSKVEVAVTPQSKLNLEYSLSGNSLEAIYTNPYVDSRVIMEDGENKLQLGKNITSTLRLNTYTTQYDGFNTVELVKNLRVNTTASISSSSYFKNEGKSPRETITRVAYTRSF